MFVCGHLITFPRTSQVMQTCYVEKLFLSVDFSLFPVFRTRPAKSCKTYLGFGIVTLYHALLCCQMFWKASFYTWQHLSCGLSVGTSIIYAACVLLSVRNLYVGLCSIFMAQLLLRYHVNVAAASRISCAVLCWIRNRISGCTVFKKMLWNEQVSEVSFRFSPSSCRERRKLTIT